MYDDPIVDETRTLRDEYAKQFNYDLNAICCDLMERQQRSVRRVVRRQPKRPSDQSLCVRHVTERSDAAERE
jgi:hypothetical protein